MAFIIANFFHAWQYYAMLYWSEKKALTQRLFSPKFSTIGVIGIFTVITLAFGAFVVFVFRLWCGFKSVVLVFVS